MLQNLQQKLTASSNGKLLTTFLPEGRDEEDVLYIQLDLHKGEHNLHWSKDICVLGEEDAIDNNSTSETTIDSLHTMVMNWVGLDITSIPLENWVEEYPKY